MADERTTPEERAIIANRHTDNCPCERCGDLAAEIKAAREERDREWCEAHGLIHKGATCDPTQAARLHQEIVKASRSRSAAALSASTTSP